VGEVVDVVEDQPGARHALADRFDEVHEALGEVDPGAVRAQCHLWVAILIEVEAVKTALRQRFC
jgi:hypothetical protein